MVRSVFSAASLLPGFRARWGNRLAPASLPVVTLTPVAQRYRPRRVASPQIFPALRLPDRSPGQLSCPRRTSTRLSPGGRMVGTQLADAFWRERTAASQRTRTRGRIDLAGRRPGEPGCSRRHGPWQGPRRRKCPHPPVFARSPVRPSGTSCLLAAAASTPPRRMVRSELPAFSRNRSAPGTTFRRECKFFVCRFVVLSGRVTTKFRRAWGKITHCLQPLPIPGSRQRTSETRRVRRFELTSGCAVFRLNGSTGPAVSGTEAPPGFSRPSGR